jgi:uncharacterized membrane protein YgcG
MVVAVVCFALARLARGCAALDVFRSLENLKTGQGIASHRAMQELTDEELSTNNQCNIATNDVFEENPAYNYTVFAVVNDFVGSKANNCSLERSTAGIEGLVCKIDTKGFEDGIPFEAAVTACIELGGVIVFISAYSTCADFELTFEVNYPQCALSQEVEPACDPDVLMRFFIDYSLLFDPRAYDESCTTTSSFEIISGDDESGGNGGTETESGGGTGTGSGGGTETDSGGGTEAGNSGGSNSTSGQDSVDRSASPCNLHSAWILSFVGSAFAVSVLM